MVEEPEDMLVQLRLMGSRHVSDATVLGTLEGANVGDDSPPVLRDQFVTVAKHGVFTVGDGIKDHTFRLRAEHIAVQVDRSAPAVLCDDSTTVTDRAVARCTVDFITLLTPFHECTVDDYGGRKSVGKFSLSIAAKREMRIGAKIAPSDHSSGERTICAAIGKEL